MPSSTSGLMKSTLWMICFVNCSSRQPSDRASRRTARVSSTSSRSWQWARCCSSRERRAES
eukprot:3633720-Rhodomonas_salina.2